MSQDEMLKDKTPPDKMSQDRTSHRQIVTGQNVTQIKCHKIKRHLDKTPPGQNVIGKYSTSVKSQDKLDKSMSFYKRSIKAHWTNCHDSL